MIAKMLDIARTEGLKGITVRLKHRLYLKTYIYQTDIPPGDDLLDGYDYQVLLLTEELIEQLIREHPAEYTKEKGQQWLKTLAPDATDKVYVMVDANGETMNYSCVSYGDNYEPRMRFNIKAIPQNVYIYDCYTFEKHRNKGVQKFSILSLFKEARNNGCKTATCMIDDGNVFSEKAFMKLGFKRIGYIATYHLFFGKLNRRKIF
jgi:L-amino acid N-acyltransferase YncA